MIVPLFVLLVAGFSAASEADVIPLVEEWRLDRTVSTYTIITYSTLIKDGEHTIVVDLPPTNETASIDKMLEAIKGKDLEPEDIQKLVITHGHPKDFGQNSVFPKAHQYFSTYEHNGKTFLRTGLYENGKMQLTPNVQLWYTPGNSAEDITVVVSKVTNRGIVAITGNLIFNSTDVLHSEFWESRAQHPQAGMKRRRKVVCHADYIIPGHGPIFQVTDQHREAVKCINKGESGAEDSDVEQQRRRRQHDHERNQYQGSERQRHEQIRRERQSEYEQRLAQWNYEQQQRARQPQHQGASHQVPIGQGASVSGGHRPEIGDSASVSNGQDAQSWAGCCQQQPCHSGQQLCRDECCVQPPCRANVPPCRFESTCCDQEQNCAWNQVRCPQQDGGCQQNCNNQRNCNQCQQTCNRQQSCGTKEIHHHYVGSTEEVYQTQDKREHSDLITTLNDQQKQMREDQTKVNQILLDHIHDNYKEFKNYVEKETEYRKDFNNLVQNNVKALIELLQQQQQLFQHESHKQQPVLASMDNLVNKVNRRMDEHKQVTDQFWAHQKHVQDTKKAQEEKTFRRVVRPAYNFTVTKDKPAETCRQTCPTPCAPAPAPPCRQPPCPPAPEAPPAPCPPAQPCPQPQPQPPCQPAPPCTDPPCAPAPPCPQQPCEPSCQPACGNDCNGCGQSCNGCAQSSNGGCSGCGSDGGCGQTGCSGASGARQHRHAPGQRHFGRRRLRRQEADEKIQMVKLQQLLTAEQKRDGADDDFF